MSSKGSRSIASHQIFIPVNLGRYQNQPHLVIILESPKPSCSLYLPLPVLVSVVVLLELDLDLGVLRRQAIQAMLDSLLHVADLLVVPLEYLELRV